MKVGFIGAGRMGFTMGKHLKDALTVVGYYSRSLDSAKEAAQFTDSQYFEKLEDLVMLCDVIFITVPDGQIVVMADELGKLDKSLLDGKILIHTSGALASDVFSDIDSQIYGYSIHPMYAVSSKLESYLNFSDSFITIEGNAKYLDYFKELFISLGHNVSILSANDKIRYHGACVCASNLVIGLYKVAMDELVKCGFTEKMADKALKPLFINNANKLYNSNLSDALTGPIERCDEGTVKKHLETFEDDTAEIYKLLSRRLVDVAVKKHTDGIEDADTVNEINGKYDVIRKQIN